ncbi:hypothetical protein NPIL_507871 [Nephila pilipes]|uniref:Endonuclease/exonuclease/phosphatase domain-containing protein n=1 Tax=Nephila pilipes TaxID=299642 RepID=A0A8X6MU07_NEPPI|nr:hypothetical protein NPIL_507871 [Nephila pilipes]
MNAYSLWWGYNDANASGKKFEYLLNSSSLEIIFNASDPPTYLHYNGRDNNPDLLCVSADLSDYSKRRVIEDPDSRHRQIITSIVLPGSERKKPKEHQKVSWDFKNADRSIFRELTEEKMQMKNFNFCSPPCQFF